jgi:hypothetical protein
MATGARSSTAASVAFANACIASANVAPGETFGAIGGQ